MWDLVGECVWRLLGSGLVEVFEDVFVGIKRKGIFVCGIDRVVDELDMWWNK